MLVSWIMEGHTVMQEKKFQARTKWVEQCQPFTYLAYRLDQGDCIISHIIMGLTNPRKGLLFAEKGRKGLP